MKILAMGDVKSLLGRIIACLYNDVICLGGLPSYKGGAASAVACNVYSQLQR